MKADRTKDPRNKEKYEISRSLQNLTYLVPSSNTELINCLEHVAKDYDVDKYEHIFGKMLFLC